MKVCVQGLWHLGSVTAACIASLGHEVVGFDFDSAKIERMNQGVLPLFEPGLEDIVKKGLSSGNLRFSSSIDDATKEIEVLWVSYDTPVDDDDKADVDFVVAQIERILPYLPVSTSVLVSSQMPVGSTRHLEKIASSKLAEQKLDFAYSPENLRLGKALDAFLKPDRLVVGVRTDKMKERLGRLLKPITERIEWMTVESAEMTKHAINAFLATSVTFINEVASICELVGADAKEVERGLKTENRIGPKSYLSPGGAFAGGTLARDISFLNQVGNKKQLVTPLLSSVNPSNEEHKQWVKRRLRAIFPDIASATVAVWGLTYKPGTDTLRRSMAVELCDWLLQQGVNVHVHDPVVTELPSRWSGKVKRFDNPLDAIQGALALVVATAWPLYSEIPAEQLAKCPDHLTVLDENRILPGFRMVTGVRYVAVGTSTG